jgi:glycosyltransferase involved in cell wall biosynthesis
MTPMFTVLTPTDNHAHTVDSFERVVVDDGSAASGELIVIFDSDDAGHRQAPATNVNRVTVRA